MASSFEDDIRRAAGLPTVTEIVERKTSEERAAKMRADDQPRQKALVVKFETSIAPLIDQVFKQAARALAADSDIQLIACHTSPSDLLADKSYVVDPKPDPQLPRGRYPKIVLISSLHFTLHADGQVSAATPDVVSAPPTLRVGMSAIRRPMEDFTSELIENIFTNYIKAAVGVVRSAKNGS